MGVVQGICVVVGECREFDETMGKFGAAVAWVAGDGRGLGG